MGKKLTVYMIDGTEFGPRYAEIGNWVGKAFYAPRASLHNILLREEFNNPGVYCLKSKPDSDVYSEKIYIGEAEIMRDRIKYHLADADRDFEELIFFISKDELLTKTQIKFLESHLIRLAKEAKASEIENAQSPNLPTLHEADVSDMEYFLDQMKLIFPLMGFNFLKPVVAPLMEASSTTTNATNYYNIKSGSFKATMYESEQGFVVLKHSQANKKLSNSITETYRRLQQKLIDKKILTDMGDFYEFSQDTFFSSPSAASNIVLGRQSAGPNEWINSKGQTYKDATSD